MKYTKALVLLCLLQAQAKQESDTAGKDPSKPGIVEQELEKGVKAVEDYELKEVEKIGGEIVKVEKKIGEVEKKVEKTTEAKVEESSGAEVKKKPKTAR